MKIVGIETFLVGNPWKNWLFVKVNTDEGIHGIGEGTLGQLARTVEAAIRDIKHYIIGLDIFQTELLVTRLSRNVYADGGQVKMCAISALEIACWDAMGKALNQPIYNLVGGRTHERIPAYVNGWYRCERTPEAFAKAAKRVSEMGYFAMKFDPFGAAHARLTPNDEDLAIDLVAAVRDTVGPGALLAIEAHSRFTPSSAIRIGKRLEPFRPAWFEEPVPHGNVEAMVEVARHLSIPLATGESFSSKHQLAELLRHEAVDIFNVEPLHMGGILGTRKVADMIDAHYGTIIPHAAQGPISTLACLHIDAATPNSWLQESFEDFNEPWERDLLTAFPRLADGYFELPQGPGLGADLNLEEVRRHPFDPNNRMCLFEENWQFRETKKLR